MKGKEDMKENCTTRRGNRTWLLFSGLIALGITFMVVRELPALRRELHLLSM